MIPRERMSMYPGLDEAVPPQVLPAAIQPEEERAPQSEEVPDPPAKFTFATIQSAVEKMGGLDGILDTVTKVHKVVTTVQQMVPMFQLLKGSFNKTSSSKDTESRGLDDEPFDTLPSIRSSSSPKKSKAKRRRPPSHKKELVP